MKITLEFKKEDLIRMDFIEKAINALLNEKEELEALDNRCCEGCIYVGKSNCINCLSCKRQYSDNWRNK